jgi:HEAT repeat protein
MSARNSSRGISPPSFGQGLVIAAAVCGAWIIWSEARDRGWISGTVQPAVNLVDRLHESDAAKPRGPVSIAPLIAELSNEFDPNARRQALLQLSSIGPDAAEAIEAIRERLKDEDEGVRYAAVLALSRVSQGSEQFLAELPALLNDSSRGVRELAADALADIGRPATELALDLVRSDSPATRSQALFVLQRIVCPETFPAIAEAIDLLCHDPNPEIRTEALVVCVDWGIFDVAAIRYLLRTDLMVPNVRRRPDMICNSFDAALKAMTWLGPDAVELVPDLVALLAETPQLEVTGTRTEGGRQINAQALAPRVSSILGSLRFLKTAVRAAVPHLLGRLPELDPRNRLTVIDILREIGAEPVELKSVLTGPVAESNRADAQRVATLFTRALADSDQSSVFSAASLLARVDPAEARRQVAQLALKFADPNKPIDRVTLDALWGLERAAKDEGLPFLISLLSERGSLERSFATMILGSFGPGAAPAVPKLIANLERSRRQVEFQTIETLGNIGPDAKSAVPVLLEILNDSTLAPPPANNSTQTQPASYHEYAMRALGKIGDADPEVLAAIRKHLSNESPAQRSTAMHALARLAPDSPQVLNEIVEILRNDTVGNVRAHAALAISSMSGDRDPAVEPLAEALQDSDTNIRKMATIALGSTGPAAKPALPALRQALLESRCGIPNLPTPIAGQNAFQVPREKYGLDQLPLIQALRQALIAIEREE